MFSKLVTVLCFFVFPLWAFALAERGGEEYICLAEGGEQSVCVKMADLLSSLDEEGPGTIPFVIEKAEDWPIHTAEGPGHQGWYIKPTADDEGFWLIRQAKGPIPGIIGRTNDGSFWAIRQVKGPGTIPFVIEKLNEAFELVGTAEGPGTIPFVIERLKTGPSIQLKDRDIKAGILNLQR